MAKNILEQELRKHRGQIRKEAANWRAIQKYGCHDPFWPDGVNMNLVRNHIIYHKKQIEEICQKLGCCLPEEYYYATPPKVDQNYMANLTQKERVKRLRQMGDNLTTKKPEYDDRQLSFL